MSRNSGQRQRTRNWKPETRTTRAGWPGLLTEKEPKLIPKEPNFLPQGRIFIRVLFMPVFDAFRLFECAEKLTNTKSNLGFKKVAKFSKKDKNCPKVYFSKTGKFECLCTLYYIGNKDFRPISKIAHKEPTEQCSLIFEKLFCTSKKSPNGTKTPNLVTLGRSNLISGRMCYRCQARKSWKDNEPVKTSDLGFASDGELNLLRAWVWFPTLFELQSPLTAMHRYPFAIKHSRLLMLPEPLVLP